MFRNVLIANRGEIALRLIRACREQGIGTVVVYSDADRDAPWIEEADRDVCIGPARASASYLDADAILQAAEQTSCQAIHPGYGFLAENALFAARCEQQGLTFIGPTAGAILLMGDKIRAKRTMAEVGLPTVPGSAGALRDVAHARAVAAKVGYPVLLKASAGGGGRGMRRCAGESDLERAFKEAAMEAEKAFGDPQLYLEKFIGGGRHIEFQVLCDGLGGAVHLGERECSVQRKHQKLVEECPSPAVNAANRARFGRKVARAVARLGYRNAGTVEFLRSEEGEFYFMEMNTRLQVEHPVTEAVTGVDIVREQLRLAVNRPLALSQREVTWTGHAIEFRINAEDPANDFKPDPGEITRFRPATSERIGATIRWDSPVREGYRIPPHYDSLIGKLIVHAADRPAAIEAAREALTNLELRGVQTTRSLHLRLLDCPAFRSGDYDIGLLASSGLLSATED